MRTVQLGISLLFVLIGSAQSWGLVVGAAVFDGNRTTQIDGATGSMPLFAQARIVQGNAEVAARASADYGFFDPDDLAGNARFETNLKAYSLVRDGFAGGSYVPNAQASATLYEGLVMRSPYPGEPVPSSISIHFSVNGILAGTPGVLPGGDESAKVRVRFGSGNSTGVAQAELVHYTGGTPFVLRYGDWDFAFAEEAVPGSGRFSFFGGFGLHLPVHHFKSKEPDQPDWWQTESFRVIVSTDAMSRGGFAEADFEHTISVDAVTVTGSNRPAPFAEFGLVSQFVLAGDYNDDGVVNAVDYTVWRNNVGGIIPHNETASLGIADAADYSEWKANYGSTRTEFTSFAVPEPGILNLLATSMTIAFVILVRHRL
jgi:hypothetical protein